jgi:bacterioferritin
MGTRGREIVGTDVEQLVEQLNSALADEWLAYYQYWVGAKVIKGPMRGAVAAELLEHAADELRHAEMLAERIIQLGGAPLLSPEEWYKATGCGYDAPEDPAVRAVLAQNIAGEQCAISAYQKLLDGLRGKDEVTFAMIAEVLADEVEHEEDLQAFVEDLSMIKGS